MMEQSREELIAQADQLEADAVAHERNARPEAAERSRDEAERIRAQADGAPVGPSPDAIESQVEALRGELARGRDLILEGVGVFASLDGAVVSLFVDGAAAANADGVEAAPLTESDEERAAAIDAAVADALLTIDAAVADALITERGFDIEASVPDLLDYVGDDPVKAAAVLKAEGEGGRTTLVEPLTKLLEAGTVTINEG